MKNSLSFLDSIQGKVSIITGSGRGIGAETAKKLAQAGATVILNDINEEAVASIRMEIEKIGAPSMSSTHDISSHRQAADLAQEVKSRFGRIDILVNNAGITRDALLNNLTEEKWDEVIRVNLKGPFNMGQACAREMMEQKYGKIVNIASVSLNGNIGQSNYAASKSGLTGLTGTWALELAKYNINVNAVAPGFVDSALTKKIPEDIKNKFVERIPFKRMGRPEDIANLVAFLVCDNSSYITGQCITIDGGLTTGA